MSQGVTVKFDKDRTLKYRYRDLPEISRRLGGKVSTRQLVDNLIAQDSDTLDVMMMVGLKRDDAALATDLNRIHELIEAYLDHGGTLGKLAMAIIAALQDGKVMPPDAPETEKPADPS